MTNTNTNTKPSFYKSFEERLIKSAVDYLYNEYVGGEENHWLDHGERYYNFDEKELCDLILERLLTEKHHLWLEDGFAIESKHIRFVGKQRVSEIVNHRVEFRHNKEGWEWEN